jgi:hypothetical protein
MTAGFFGAEIEAAVSLPDPEGDSDDEGAPSNATPAGNGLKSSTGAESEEEATAGRMAVGAGGCRRKTTCAPSATPRMPPAMTIMSVRLSGGRLGVKPVAPSALRLSGWTGGLGALEGRGVVVAPDFGDSNAAGHCPAALRSFRKPKGSSAAVNSATV